MQVYVLRCLSGGQEEIGQLIIQAEINNDTVNVILGCAIDSRFTLHCRRASLRSHSLDGGPVSYTP